MPRQTFESDESEEEEEEVPILRAFNVVKQSETTNQSINGALESLKEGDSDEWGKLPIDIGLVEENVQFRRTPWTVAREGARHRSSTLHETLQTGNWAPPPSQPERARDRIDSPLRAAFKRQQELQIPNPRSPPSKAPRLSDEPSSRPTYPRSVSDSSPYSRLAAPVIENEPSLMQKKTRKNLTTPSTYARTIDEKPEPPPSLSSAAPRPGRFVPAPAYRLPDRPSPTKPRLSRLPEPDQVMEEDDILNWSTLNSKPPPPHPYNDVVSKSVERNLSRFRLPIFSSPGSPIRRKSQQLPFQGQKSYDVSHRITLFEPSEDLETFKSRLQVERPRSPPTIKRMRPKDPGSFTPLVIKTLAPPTPEPTPSHRRPSARLLYEPPLISSSPTRQRHVAKYQPLHEVLQTPDYSDADRHVRFQTWLRSLQEADPRDFDFGRDLVDEVDECGVGVVDARSLSIDVQQEVSSVFFNTQS